MTIATAQDFQKLVDHIESQAGYRRPAAFGLGLATFAIADLSDASALTDDAVALDTWFPAPNLNENYGTAAILANLVGHRGGTASYRVTLAQLVEARRAFAPFIGAGTRGSDGQSHANLTALLGVITLLERHAQAVVAYGAGQGSLDAAVPKSAVVTFIGDLADAPVDLHDAYLRLHLLSSRKLRPHACNLDGLFGKMANVVWTNVGPFSPLDFEAVRLRLRGEGVHVQVHSIDKFPRMSDYVIPTGIRLADADRARLGAHLGEGTTVMHEGFVNFNAGTVGTSMVEGRISAGVVVGKGSDLGGSASVMGTLSGGGKMVISIGEDCLLGANSGCGISLGNNCTIEAGCYITAGAKVRLPDGSVVKAAELSGKSNLLFIRNSLTGALEVRFKKNETRLNDTLHKND